MLVQRVWFTLVILPSLNILSHTLQKTWNFCSRVRVSAPSHFAMIRVICALVVIINFRKKEELQCDAYNHDYQRTCQPTELIGRFVP